MGAAGEPRCVARFVITEQGKRVVALALVQLY
jgi:hypothetical protein